MGKARDVTVGAAAKSTKFVGENAIQYTYQYSRAINSSMMSVIALDISMSKRVGLLRGLDSLKSVDLKKFKTAGAGAGLVLTAAESGKERSYADSDKGYSFGHRLLRATE